jgi:polar amino acid transport system substrate-binding protein
MFIRSLVAALAALLMASCAGPAAAPSATVRQALAPSGKLRVALLDGNAVHALKDAKSGEYKGVGYDLGKAFAADLGVPFEPVLFTGVGPMLEAGKTGRWDVAFIGASPERSRWLDFTASHLLVEYGYLVAPGSPLAAAADVDRAGTRVAVLQRSSPDEFLSQSLKRATLLRVPTMPQGLALLNSKGVDVLAGAKPNMHALAARTPGSRVLAGFPGTEAQAMAIPKGRPAEGLAYARTFIERAKAAGVVQAAAQRAGLRGVTVAPAAR